MSLRTSKAIALLVLLGACHQQPSEQNAVANAGVEAKQDVDAAQGERIECAPPGASEFSNVCTVERSADQNGAILTVRQPDGGFHRLRVTGDVHGVVAADGAEKAVVTVLDPARIQVAIGEARYRLPATIGPLPRQ